MSKLFTFLLGELSQCLCAWISPSWIRAYSSLLAWAFIHLGVIQLRMQWFKICLFDKTGIATSIHRYLNLKTLWNVKMGLANLNPGIHKKKLLLITYIPSLFIYAIVQETVNATCNILQLIIELTPTCLRSLSAVVYFDQYLVPQTLVEIVKS